MRVITVFFVSIALSGCTAYTAAEKALGPGAIKVDASYGKKIVAPGIYRVRDVTGSGAWLTQVCPDDFKTQKALKAIKHNTQNFDSTIADDDKYQGLQITIPGIGLGFLSTGQTSYTPEVELDRVEKYSVTQIDLESPESAADYMYKNVADNCRNNILNKGGRFLFVEAEARGKNVTRIRTGGLSTSANAPYVGIGYNNQSERVIFQKPDVSFGVSGDVQEFGN